MPPKKTVKTGGATGGATGGTDSSDDDKTVTVGVSHAEVENVIGQRLAQQQAAIDDRLGNMQAQMQAQMQQMMAMLQGFQAAGAAGAVQNQPPQQQQPPPPVPQAPQPQVHRSKKIDLPLLESPDDATLASFKLWQGKFQGYALVSRLEQECSLEARRSILAASLKPGWDSLWKGRVLGIEAADDIDVIIRKIGDFLRRHRNPILDRRDFLQRNQHPGESVDHYHAALRMIDDNCSYEENPVCPDCNQPTGAAEAAREERIRDRIISGLADASIQSEVLKVPFDDLTLEQTLRICRAEEASRSTQTGLKGGSVNQMQGRQGQGASRGRSQSRGRKSDYKKRRERSWSAKRDTEEKCGGCGRPKHQDKKDCPAYGKECRLCKKIGHFAAHCRSSQSGCDSVFPSFIGAVEAYCPLDTIRVEFKSLDGQHLKTLDGILPDTGSGVNLMNVRTYRLLGQDPHALRCMGDALEAANNLSINTLGRAKFLLTYGRVTHPVEFVITDEYRRGVLINQQTCKMFGVVPQSFPAQVAAIESEPDVKTLREELLAQYSDVFDGDKPLKPMGGPPMKIKLKDGAEPFQIRGPRPLPIPMKTEAKKLLDDFVDRGVLKKVSEPTEWVHGMTLVRKPSGKLRLCVDLRPLNKYVERPHHPLRSPRDVVNSISPTAKWFSTFDAAHGYFQVPLAEESQSLTCFLTEWGRYAFQRATMGLISAGDEYNRRSEEALEGLTGLVKLVDDICIFSDTYEEHVEAIKRFLDRCQAHGITLNADKMKLAKPEVKFAGFLVGREGIKADPEKLAAIRCFPTPRNLTDLRSFQGLVEQLGNFSTAVAEAMRPLRPLLSPKAQFRWTSDHDQAFAAAKKALSAPPVLGFFDPLRPTKLETDAARTKGLGYVMRQQAPDGKWMLIEAGSRFISETEARYSMVELELLAVVWAVKKCRLYLAGLPNFTLVVDHQPLRSILDKKTLDQVETPRIQRLKMA
jgi:hypothetical protein